MRKLKQKCVLRLCPGVPSWRIQERARVQRLPSVRGIPSPLDASSCHERARHCVPHSDTGSGDGGVSESFDRGEDATRGRIEWRLDHDSGLNYAQTASVEQTASAWGSGLAHVERESDFVIDNLPVRIHLIIEIIVVDRPCAMGV